MSSLIVGGGLTSAATYHFLQQRLSQSISKGSFLPSPSLPSSNVAIDKPVWDTFPDIQVWEKEKSVGGRMSNTFLHTRHDETRPVYLRADMGAQYVSRRGDSGNHQSVYDLLLQRDVFLPLEQLSVSLIEGTRSSHCDMQHFIAWRGTSSIITSLFDSGSDGHVHPTSYIHNPAIRLQRQLTRLDLAEDGKRWLAHYSDDGAVSNDHDHVKVFQQVVLCLPPHALDAVEGNWRGVIGETPEGQTFLDSLAQVTFSSRSGRHARQGQAAPADCVDRSMVLTLFMSCDHRRFAAAIFLSEQCRHSLHEALPWLAKYVDRDDVIRYISLESRKLRPGLVHNEGECIVVHTTIPFGLVHRNDDQAIVLKLIIDSLVNLLPIIRDHLNEATTHLVHWKESQVTRGVPVQYTHSASACKPLYSFVHQTIGGATMALAGDYFTESNFDGCLTSADCAVTRLLALDQNKS